MGDKNQLDRIEAQLATVTSLLENPKVPPDIAREDDISALRSSIDSLRDAVEDIEAHAEANHQHILACFKALYDGGIYVIKGGKP